MGSRFKKALVAESVRESLHSWCKRVKERSKRDSLHSHTTRSVCSLDTTIDEGDEITIASGTLSRSSSLGSLNQVTVVSTEQPQVALQTSRVEEYLSETLSINNASELPANGEEEEDTRNNAVEEQKVQTLLELFQNT